MSVLVNLRAIALLVKKGLFIMNAKQITLKNITDNGYIIGKSVKGKGLEIFSNEKTVFYKYLGTCSNKEIEDKLSKHDKSKLFIESYRVSSDTSWVCNQRIPLDDFVLDLASLECFSIKKESSLLGYISVSKYTSDRSSQVSLLEDLICIEGFKVDGDVFDDYYDAVEYNDEVKDFQKDKWYEDYHLEHGSGLCGDYAEFFNGRMDNHNESVMSHFEFDEGEYLKYIDIEEDIFVYHRKAKDWYVGYSLNSRDMTLSYKRDDYNYDKDDCEEDEVVFLIYKENTEKLQKVMDFLKIEKENLEVDSYIENELDEDYDYRDTSFSVPSLEFLFDELSDLRQDIRDNIDWEYKNIKSNFQKTLNKLIDDKLEIDEKFIVTINGSKYKQLRKLYKLGKLMDFELVKSAISADDSNITWAIKKDNEEYHFSPLNLIYFDEEGEQDVKEFAENALHAIEKRKIAKLSEKELYEKASRVFISVEDSLKSGNCKFGTETFIARHGIDLNKIGGIRGDYLLNIEKSNFTTRAVQYAIQRAS